MNNPWNRILIGRKSLDSRSFVQLNKIYQSLLTDIKMRRKIALLFAINLDEKSPNFQKNCMNFKIRKSTLNKVYKFASLFPAKECVDSLYINNFPLDKEF